MRFPFAVAVFTLVALSNAHAAPEPTTAPARFTKDGTWLVDGKPFFPIGVWVYNLNPEVMADLHDHHFNTVVGMGFGPADLPLIEKHGLMCIPHATDDFLNAAANSPSLLGWHLTDEPEEHNVPPEEVRKLYAPLKPRTTHPIGVTHCQQSAHAKYTEGSDFTMSDVYPVDRERKWPLKVVGEYVATARQVHGDTWPTIAIIQSFGGPETDGGIWAQPLPSEVRFMVFNALANRANGICYFSYWPRAATTWRAIAEINRDVRRIVPWLIQPGEEIEASASQPAMQVRARKVGNGHIVIVTNNEPKPTTATFTLPTLGDATLRLPYENRALKSAAGKWRDAFDAYEAKVYLVGDDPGWP